MLDIEAAPESCKLQEDNSPATALPAQVQSPARAVQPSRQDLRAYLDGQKAEVVAAHDVFNHVHGIHALRGKVKTAPQSDRLQLNAQLNAAYNRLSAMRIDVSRARDEELQQLLSKIKTVRPAGRSAEKRESQRIVAVDKALENVQVALQQLQQQPIPQPPPSGSTSRRSVAGDVGEGIKYGFNGAFIGALGGGLSLVGTALGGPGSVLPLAAGLAGTAAAGYVTKTKRMSNLVRIPLQAVTIAGVTYFAPVAGAIAGLSGIVGGLISFTKNYEARRREKERMARRVA